MKNYSISKNETAYVKGIAIIYMLLHHLVFSSTAITLTGRDFATANIYNILCQYFRICVPTFAFLTGWGYAVKQRITMTYVIKKIILLLLGYNLVFFSILPFAIRGGGIDLIYQIFCWKW